MSGSRGLKIITANWREIRVRCDCGNDIAVVLGTRVVKCKCGRKEHMAALQDGVLDERKVNGKLDGYLAAYGPGRRTAR